MSRYLKSTLLHHPSLFASLAALVLAGVMLFTRSASSQGGGSPPPNASPFVIPFQGQVTSQSGTLVPAGQYSIIFNLYDTAVGGQPIWTERHSKVGVLNGMINVFLGSINASLAAQDFATTKYLGITVDVDDKPTTADPEMVPRQMILPSFAAKTSERARKMDVLDANGQPVAGQSYGWSAIMDNGNPSTGTIAGSRITNGTVTTGKIQDGTITLADLSPSVQAGSLPVGAVVMWWGHNGNIPSGWELCNGGAPTTPGATLTGNKPNFIDKFPKGSDGTTANVAVGNGTGGQSFIPDRNSAGHTLTIDQIPAHTHDSGGAVNFIVETAGPGIIAGGTAFGKKTNTGTAGGGQPHSHVIPGHDNRPAYQDIFFIIRVM